MSADTNFTNAFLMTYRTFMESSELLDRLVARYYIEAPSDIKPDEHSLWVEQKQKLIRMRYRVACYRFYNWLRLIRALAKGE